MELVERVERVDLGAAPERVELGAAPTKSCLLAAGYHEIMPATALAKD